MKYFVYSFTLAFLLNVAASRADTAIFSHAPLYGHKVTVERSLEERMRDDRNREHESTMQLIRQPAIEHNDAEGVLEHRPARKFCAEAFDCL